jgi:hypothetical protein
MLKFLPLLFAVFLLPLVADAQFGPIVPEVCRQCPCGFGGVLAIIQNLVNFIIGIAIIFATIIIVWGGILYVLSPANPENRNTANKMLINAVVGILITLSAWLIVDFVMKTLYGGQFGPWNTILLNGSGPSCVEARENTPLFSGDIAVTPGAGGNNLTPGNEGSFNPTTGPHPDADNRFTYDSGISNQVVHASPRLRQLMSCMAARVPADVGRVSSISDNRIVSGSKTFAQCRDGGQSAGCAHSARSCHYGGRCNVENSYAVDFGDEQNANTLRAAAQACGADYIGFEGTHLHVSVGQSVGCQCN